MYICLCNAVTDQDISDAVQSGAKTFSQVQSQLAVSTGCGRCEPMAQAQAQAAAEWWQPTSLLLGRREHQPPQRLCAQAALTVRTKARGAQARQRW